MISVLYHVLKGADNCDAYVRDVEKENDRELADFFIETKKKYMEIAEKVNCRSN